MFYCPEFPWQLYVGKHLKNSRNVKSDLDLARSQSFDYISVPILSQEGSFISSDYALNPSEWNSCVVGVVTCEQPVLTQINWGIYVGMHSIIVPLTQRKNSDLARAINQVLEKGLSFSKIVVEVDVSDWQTWNEFRLLLKPSPFLGVCLVLKDQELTNAEIWEGEPVMHVRLLKSAFVSNSGSFVLSKSVQSLVRKLFKLLVTVTLPESLESQALRGYICYLFQNQPKLSLIESSTFNFWDCLQAPLQPLMNNLESVTYNQFEQDSPKYKLYQEAIGKALEDNPEFSVVMVVGAGRGPIVRAALCAAAKLNRKLKVFALDKNKNAIATLMNLKQTEWSQLDVSVVEKDMRNWEPPVKAHLVVSELLGGFGDNELEPECLAHINRLLTEGGLSIPCKSTSYLSPVASQRNWVNAVKLQNKLEQPYVCKLHNAYMPHSPSPVFSFEYPSENSFSKFCSLRFSLSGPLTLHGFGGYFESQLYKDVKLTTVPSTHSTDMCSWFPMYFPIKEPLFGTQGEVEVNVWRCNQQGKVWYEWEMSIVEEELRVATSGVHNINGLQHWIGLYT